jgi:hypothetical protein
VYCAVLPKASFIVLAAALDVVIGILDEVDAEGELVLLFEVKRSLLISVLEVGGGVGCVGKMECQERSGEARIEGAVRVGGLEGGW